MEKVMVSIPTEGLVELLECKAKINVLCAYMESTKPGYASERTIKNILGIPVAEEQGDEFTGLL